jgi:23S rRNA (uracil1939-C5)-methyltransferase
LQLTIEKLVYGGDGLARLPADANGPGKTVLMPFVIAGEDVEASVAQSRPGFVRAKLNTILKPSPERIEPDCPYFGRCGGCQYQHINYQAQLRYKADILRETLRRTAKLDLAVELHTHSGKPWQYRNRTRVRVQHTPTFQLGYFRTSSHQLLPIEQCPISSPLINRAVRAALELGSRNQAPQTLHGLQFFANHADDRILVEAYVRPGTTAKECQPFAAAMHELLPAMLGLVVFPTSATDDDSHQFAPLTAVHPESGQGIGADSLDYQAVGHQFRVSAGSFFQVNRFLIDELVRTAVPKVTGRAALDLYAGAGLFTLALAKQFDQVLAVETSSHSSADLRHNAPSNVKAIRATTENFLAQRGPKLAPDFVIVDPPRAGLGERTARSLGRMSVPRVTYVSCDPATLARDLRPLLESGFRVAEAHLMDLFPQTAHMETVLHLVR